jgi:hypothetical protein
MPETIYSKSFETLNKRGKSRIKTRLREIKEEEKNMRAGVKCLLIGACTSTNGCIPTASLTALWGVAGGFKRDEKGKRMGKDRPRRDSRNFV